MNRASHKVVATALHSNVGRVLPSVWQCADALPCCTLQGCLIGVCGYPRCWCHAMCIAGLYVHCPPHPDGSLLCTVHYRVESDPGVVTSSRRPFSFQPRITCGGCGSKYHSSGDFDSITLPPLVLVLKEVAVRRVQSGYSSTLLCAYLPAKAPVSLVLATGPVKCSFRTLVMRIATPITSPPQVFLRHFPVQFRKP